MVWKFPPASNNVSNYYWNKIINNTVGKYIRIIYTRISVITDVDER